MIEPRYIANLILKKIKGELTPKEASDLENWSKASPLNEIFIKTRANPTALANDLNALLNMDLEAIQRKCNERCPEAAVSHGSHNR